jgi:hypothetical protein
MSDDLKDQGEEHDIGDEHAIDMSEPVEVKYWTSELDVGADTLRGAIFAVGPGAGAVRKYLENRYGGRSAGLGG